MGRPVVPRGCRRGRGLGDRDNPTPVRTGRMALSNRSWILRGGVLVYEAVQSLLTEEAEG